MRLRVDTSIWSKVFSGKGLRVITKMEELGFSTIDIAIAHPKIFPIALVKAEMARMKLEVVTIMILGAETNLIPPGEAIRESGVETFKRLMDINKELGSTILGSMNYAGWGCLSGKPKTDEEWNHSVGAICEAARYVKGTHPQLRVCMEPANCLKTHFINTTKEGVRYCRAVSTGSMAVHLDCFHMIREEIGYREAAEVYEKAYLGYVCVYENNRGIPGTELVPWEEFFTALHDVEYEGPYVIESSDPSFKELNTNCTIRRKLVDTGEKLTVQGLANLRCIIAGPGV